MTRNIDFQGVLSLRTDPRIDRHHLYRNNRGVAGFTTPCAFLTLPPDGSDTAWKPGIWPRRGSAESAGRHSGRKTTAGWIIGKSLIRDGMSHGSSPFRAALCSLIRVGNLVLPGDPPPPRSFGDRAGPANLSFQDRARRVDLCAMSRNLSELARRKGIGDNLFSRIGEAGAEGTPSGKDMERLADEFLIGPAIVYGTATFYDLLMELGISWKGDVFLLDCSINEYFLLFYFFFFKETYAEL